MKLRVGKRAQQQAKRIDAWWVEHRPLAPTLFLDELERTFRYIVQVRDAGVRWPTPRRPSLRRILVLRSQSHVYFVIDNPSATVHVLTVWGAPRGTTPKRKGMSLDRLPNRARAGRGTLFVDTPAGPCGSRSTNLRGYANKLRSRQPHGCLSW